MITILSGIAVSIFFEIYYPKVTSSENDVIQSIAPLGWLLVLGAIIEVVMIYRLPEQSAPQATAGFQLKLI